MQKNVEEIDKLMTRDRVAVEGNFSQTYSMDAKSPLMDDKATLLLLRARSYRGCFKPNRLHGA